MLTNKQILRAIKIYNQDLEFRILKGNEDIGLHCNIYGDGSEWRFVSFTKLNTIKKIKSFLQY